ncbi:hypothetical protein HK105_208796 [Polyrhizophydium stewartii]|uniref:ER membrane protein complex subunit 7 beta-sandwich domain-containing protein n=1 Tax=Polyrhizophydium stewartii TaxID=2732419 RepID=A0ABR4MWT3_9FUNG|nr:hypothetical protein HK105_005823 [Polyrhizophydium stewartii]
MPDIGDLPIGTKVYINDGEYVSHVTERGTFHFPNIRDGKHVLQVLCPKYDFDRVLLEVNGRTVRASVTGAGRSWSRVARYIEVPLSLEPLGSFNFFKEREGFNIMSLFANPMLLMTGGTMLLFFLMPKMQDALVDKEAVEELKRSGDAPKLEMPDISQGLANYFAPKPAGASGQGSSSGSSPANTTAAEPAAPSSTGKKKSRK